MSEALWNWAELVAAAGGDADNVASGPQEDAPPPVTGISIDTRSLAPGDLFVALQAERDGHDFVTAAFANGAAAALVSQSYETQDGDGRLIRVGDPLKGLEAIGRAARARTDARIVAVTGSAGKTGSKEALLSCLSLIGPTHASEKSYNNHWGVPLSLARMARGARFGVFEIGMNHPGEITPLTAMVRPHVALVTTVAPVHLGMFASVAQIGEAKAEIFSGLEPGGTAVINRDNDQYDLLKRRAMAVGARVLPFGEHGDAVALLVAEDLGPRGSAVSALIEGTPVKYAVGVPGRHMVRNSLGVLAAIKALGADVGLCAAALGEMRAQPGRGAQDSIELAGGGTLTLIDESYNANPASMRAALAVLGNMPRGSSMRRIAVLGDMLELGPRSGELHRALIDDIDAAGVDRVFACGPHMRGLFGALPAACQGQWGAESSKIEAAVVADARAGDVIMVKGSLGSAMARIVDALKAALEGGGQPG